MSQLALHSNNVRKALIDAGIVPELLHEYLTETIHENEELMKVHKELLTDVEFKKRDIRLSQARILKIILEL